MHASHVPRAFGEALPNLEEIVTVFREYMITQFYLARAYEETGRLAEAIKEYQDFVSWAKDEPRNRWLVEQAKDKVWMLEKRLRETGRDQRIFFEGSGYE